jgi:ribonuclease P protein component
LVRLVKSADFARVLRVQSRASTRHFAIHYLPGATPAAKAPPRKRSEAELSTAESQRGERPVEDFSLSDPQAAHRGLGAVVPKRHARRAVTRSLLKRQIYAAAETHREALGDGLWIVRLRAPFDRTEFPSAASNPLRILARRELDALFSAVARPGPR